MTFKNKVLYTLSKKILARNRQFKDKHKGESCYIFGNGVSLKGMDLGKFSDKISIGCNSLFLHRDFDKLDCRYYQIPPPFFFFSYWPYHSGLQKNYIGLLYREKVRSLTNVNFFTSLANCLNMRGSHIYYTHHFGNKNWDLKQCEMDSVFSFMQGSTYAMIGTAIYMGFESATLVGVDYTFTPRLNAHFFEKGHGYETYVKDVYCGSLFDACQKRIKLTTIVPEGMKSDLLDYVTYSKYTGDLSNYRENTNIVKAEYLDRLNRQGCYNIGITT